MKLTRIYLCLLVLAISCSAFCADTQPRYLEITFLSTNDIHSRILPFDTPADPAKNIPAVKNLGGSARRSTIVNRVRAEMRTPVFLCDSGDTTYRRSYMGRTFSGEADMAVMNAMGYDALVPGNHDFEYSGSDIKRLISRARFPWVCANVVDAKTGETIMRPYVIKEVGGVRAAFFGMTNADIESTQDLYIGAADLNVKVLPFLEVAAKLVPELRKQADIVVLISHLGNSADAQLAQQVPGIDLILGGHWHSLFATPRMIPAGQPTAFRLGAVPIVQAGAYGEWMGRTRLIFHRGADGAYTLMSCKGEMIHIDSSIPDDPQILNIMDSLKKKFPSTPPK